MGTSVSEKQLTQQIKEKITTDPRWAEHAILELYSKQTSDEQTTHNTKWQNHEGFNGVDAELLSSFAVQIKAGRHLSEKQLVWAYKKLAKYAGQLARIVKDKESAAAYQTAEHAESCLVA